jgi:hypothetical protein
MEPQTLFGCETAEQAVAAGTQCFRLLLTGVLPVAGLQVTCGSTIKLAHSSSNARLHSHEVAYSRGSQQQSVTGFPESDNGQSYWIVHGAVVGCSHTLSQMLCKCQLLFRDVLAAVPVHNSLLVPNSTLCLAAVGALPSSRRTATAFAAAPNERLMDIINSYQFFSCQCY